jgi:hypothetical protein
MHLGHSRFQLGIGPWQWHWISRSGFRFETKRFAGAAALSLEPNCYRCDGCNPMAKEVPLVLAEAAGTGENNMRALETKVLCSTVRNRYECEVRSKEEFRRRRM